MKPASQRGLLRSAFAARCVVAFGMSWGGPAGAHVLEDIPVRPGLRDWSGDPVVIVGLGLMLAVYARGVHALWRSAGAGRGIRRWQAGAFGAGWLVLVVALLSPLDVAGGLAFSAHMLQHLLLTLLAAPLVVLGRPAVALGWGLPDWLVRFWQSAVRLRKSLGALLRPAPVLVAYVGTLWLWHAPVLYELALQDPDVHLVEHACFWASGVSFWWIVWGAVGRRSARQGGAVLLVFASAVHSAVLGALITVAPTSWYAEHELGALALGMTALEDQQLAGLLMWVPGSVVYLVAGLLLTQSWLVAGELSSRRREQAPSAGDYTREVS